jgi:hypothetical protein
MPSLTSLRREARTWREYVLQAVALLVFLGLYSAATFVWADDPDLFFVGVVAVVILGASAVRLALRLRDQTQPGERKG